MSDEASNGSRMRAVATIRRFARATNLLLAGRTFAVHGTGPFAAALTEQLTGIGLRGARGIPDYLFCTGEGVEPLGRAELEALGRTDTRPRPILLIDVSAAADAVDDDSFAPLTEGRAGIFATSAQNVVIVRPTGASHGESAAAQRIDWARRFMPVTTALAAELAEVDGVEHLRVGLSMVLEPKTAVLALVLRDAGAEVSVFAHPDETDDAVAAELRSAAIPVYARSGAAPAEHRALALEFLDTSPRLLIDDGSHLIRLAHTERPALLDSLLGAAEETTSGLRPLRLMSEAGLLRIPVVAVNDARSKTLFDNRFGTGQSCVLAILDLLDLDPAGRTVVVVGFGHVGEGVAQHAAALGATVVVAELDPVRALQATFAGHRVAPLLEAVRTADLVISATGVRHTIDLETLRACPADAAVAVAGGVPQEIAIDDAVAAGVIREPVGDRIERFTFPGGSSVLILDDGGCINITAGEGNPIEIMDLSFAVQLSAIRYLLEVGGGLEPGVHELPAAADDAVAALALRTSGLAIDSPAAARDDIPLVDWHTTRFGEEGDR